MLTCIVGKRNARYALKDRVHLKMNIQHNLRPNEDKPEENRQKVNAIKVIKKNSRAEIRENLKYDLKQAENNLKHSYTEACNQIGKFRSWKVFLQTARSLTPKSLAFP